MPRNPYRPDIDGLRALAVAAVILFHMFPEQLAGGFAGVDVFFVISGFLISRIIFDALASNRFSFVGFYARRVRRIFPALIVVLTTSLVIGWFCLLPDEFMQLGKHVAASVGFVQNFALWNEAGYFDNASDTKPLLHLWSLGIEEQYYLIWPLILWGAWKYKLDKAIVVGGVALVSFGFFLAQQSTDPVGTFYAPHTRFWELMAGSLLAVFIGRGLSVTNVQAQICSVAGLGLIVGGFHAANSNYAEAVPCLLAPAGTVLLILAGGQAWINRFILGCKPLVWLGLISYPLYLWHWPLFSFARIIGSGTPELDVRVTIIIIATIIAGLTYYCVERPLRQSPLTLQKVYVLAGLMLLVGAAGTYTYAKNGLIQREFVQAYSDSITGEDGGFAGTKVLQTCGIQELYLRNIIPDCYQDFRGPAKYALIGDSKARVLYPGLVRTSSDDGRWLYMGSDIVPVISSKKVYASRQLHAVAVQQALLGNPSVEAVTIAVSTRHLFLLSYDDSVDDLDASPYFDDVYDGMKKFIQPLTAAGKRVVLIMDNPTLAHPEDCFARKTGFGFVDDALIKTNPNCSMTIGHYHLVAGKYRTLIKMLKLVDHKNVTVFDTEQYMCDEETQTCGQRKGDRLLYKYTDHISDYVAGQIGRDLNNFLNTHPMNATR